MSGSESIGVGMRRGNGQVDCASLMVETILNSPNPEVVPNLKKGQVLAIELREASGKATLVAVTDDGETAGSVTSPIVARILECIRRGFQYVARVQKTSGGCCDVEIRPRSM